MTDSPLARLKDFRASWEGDHGLIDEASGLTVEDLDALIAQLENAKEGDLPPVGWSGS